MALGVTRIPRHWPTPNNRGSFRFLLFLLDAMQVIFPTSPLPFLESVIFSQTNSLCFLISYNLLLCLLQRCRQ